MHRSAEGLDRSPRGVINIRRANTDAVSSCQKRPYQGAAEIDQRGCIGRKNEEMHRAGFQERVRNLNAR